MANHIMNKNKKSNGFPNYPDDVQVKGSNVFKAGRFMGYVDRISNWGTDFLARCEHGKANKYFATKTEAVLYLAS